MNSAPSVSAPRTRFRQRGFTLIELLTVIAIIGILASILIPVVGAVRGKARAAQCLSNLRQIGLAMHLYADENRDSFPRRYGDNVNGADGTKTWMWKLAPYVGMSENLMGPSPLPKAAGIFVCTVFDQKAEGRVVSYGYNWHIRSTAWDYQRGALPAASRTFLVVEMRKDGDDRTRDAGDLIRRHPGSISNVLFADGHVSGLRETVKSVDPRWLP